MSRHRLCPAMPAQQLAFTIRPYSGCFFRSYDDGSILGHGGLQNGFTPVRFEKISARCPPSTVKVKRNASSSI